MLYLYCSNFRRFIFSNLNYLAIQSLECLRGTNKRMYELSLIYFTSIMFTMKADAMDYLWTGLHPLAELIQRFVSNSYYYTWRGNSFFNV